MSVVIPTRNRRESLLRLLRALASQTLPNDRYEVVVAVDGSSDGTAEAVGAFAPPYRLRAVSLDGRGRASACNAGARAASGPLLVLLDDDMEPVETFLQAHAAEHPPGSRRGVLGAVPITLGAAEPPVVTYVGEKFNRHLDRLAREAHRIGFRDFYSGNFSIARELFFGVGGFDEQFRIYGNEDGELALRLIEAGVELRYSAKALARQHYEKDFAALARDNIAKGRTAVLLSRKWPSARSELRFARRKTGSRKWRAALWTLLAASRVVPLVPNLVVRAVTRLERRRSGNLDIYYRFAIDYFYLLGARSELASQSAPNGEGAGDSYSPHGVDGHPLQ